MDGRLAADAVGKRAENHLPEAEPEEQGRNDELGVVRTRSPQVVGDGGQRRKHRVRGKRHKRYQKGDEGNELAGTQGGCSAHGSSPGVTVGCIVMGQSLIPVQMSKAFNCPRKRVNLGSVARQRQE